MRRATLLILMIPALLGQGPAGDDLTAREKLRGERLLALHIGDAEGYAIYRDAARSEKLTLRREPILRWLNPAAARGQTGDVFAWTYRGRPEVVGTIFSSPGGRARGIYHEFNSVSQAELFVERGPDFRKVTRTPGMLMAPVPGAPVPAAAAPQRLAQLRTLAREFSGKAIGTTENAGDLRLLTTPLLRFESTDPEVLDGALFAFVTSAGTDPEMILMLEARKVDAGFAWTFGAARFSALELSLKRDGQEVWNSTRGPGSYHDEAGKIRWWFFRDRIVPEVDAGPAPAPVATKPEAK